jgi:hypothetical protein
VSFESCKVSGWLALAVWADEGRPFFFSPQSATGHAPRGGDSSDTSPSIRTDVGSGGGLLGIDQPDTINPFADFDVSGMEFIGDQGMLDGGWADPWLVELLRGSMTAGGM